MIVRDDLIGHALPITPSAFNYKMQADNDSMYNTPPTYAIYIAGLVFKWVKAQGGLKAMEQHNRQGGAAVRLLDDQRLLPQPGGAGGPLADERALLAEGRALDAAFLKGAQARGMIQLKGHRSVGGMRASIYNAMPIEGVQALVQYMKEFEASMAEPLRGPGAQPDLEGRPVERLPAGATGRQGHRRPDAILVRSADLHAMDIPPRCARSPAPAPAPTTSRCRR